ncbi:hypothetical protein [Marimonas lutisalis]|uniref:hypothetical protein n=1 Tax=Marimonas lutisalis TaxID=2545756 RepID=UPI0010F5D73E|nr:hypothetical protein [Marimonas lutisalis]
MANPGKVLGTLLAVLAAVTGLAATYGGLMFAKHEMDMLHLIDIVLRRVDGQLPHFDFMTPLGIWAFEPFVMLHWAGLELGAALVWGQVMVAALLLLPVWWVGISRMNTGLAIAFGVIVLLLAVAMVHGETDVKPSLSMHYNRWAWAVAFLPLALVALPARRDNPVLDGLVIGAAMAVLALLKVTYFAAFAPAVVLGLVLRGQMRALGIAVVAGLVIAGAMTLAYGFGFWGAYLGDLLTVAGSEVRPSPGAGWARVALSPDYAAGTLLAVASVLLLRTRAKADPVGIILFVMLPGAIYVTFQNYGNDPYWLLLWGIVLLAQPRGEEVGWSTQAVGGLLALALIAPVALNVFYSPVRQATLPASVFIPVFPGQAGREDVLAVEARVEREQVRMPAYGTEGDCELSGGAIGWMRGLVDEVDAGGFAGEKVFVADIFNAFWLFGAYAPLKGGAPWYYDGLPGFDEASIVVVPRCPTDAEANARIVEMIAAQGVQMVPAHEGERMVVYRLAR